MVRKHSNQKPWWSQKPGIPLCLGTNFAVLITAPPSNRWMLDKDRRSGGTRFEAIRSQGVSGDIAR